MKKKLIFGLLGMLFVGQCFSVSDPSSSIKNTEWHTEGPNNGHNNRIIVDLLYDLGMLSIPLVAYKFGLIQGVKDIQHEYIVQIPANDNQNNSEQPADSDGQGVSKRESFGLKEVVMLVGLVVTIGLGVQG
jgi:hypothetical protein